MMDAGDTSLIAELRTALEASTKALAAWRERAQQAAETCGVLQRRVTELEATVEVLRCGDLAAFMDSELDLERMATFAQHLERCASCQRDRRGHLQVDALLRAAAAPRSR